MTEEKVLHRKVLEAAEKSEAQQQQQKRQLVETATAVGARTEDRRKALRKEQKSNLYYTKYYGAVETQYYVVSIAVA